MAVTALIPLVVLIIHSGSRSARVLKRVVLWDSHGMLHSENVKSHVEYMHVCVCVRTNRMNHKDLRLGS